MSKAITVLLAISLLAAAGLVAVRRQAAHAAQVEQAMQTLVATADLRPLQLNPAPDPALVALGQALFFDKELSGNRDVSCATCHHPTLAAGDGLALSIGVGGSGFGPERRVGDRRDFVPRNAVELFNRGAAGWQTMFWDGRVEGQPQTGFRTPAGAYLPAGLDNVLAAQAMFPVGFRDEMRGGWYSVDGYSVQPGATLSEEEAYQQPSGWHDLDVFGQPNELATVPNGAEHWPAVWDGLMARLLALPGYQSLFRAAYPQTPLNALGFEHAANAIAAFESAAYVAADTPWDRYLAGDDDALPVEAKEGALLFYGRAGCADCHRGPLFTDQDYHNIAAPQFGPGRDDHAPLDYGRYAVSGDEADRFAFRTPPLRNAALTAPYFHNGAYDSLEAAVRHHLRPAEALREYDGRFLAPDLQATLQHHPVTVEAILAALDPHLADPPRLTDGEVAHLLAFLDALTDPAATDLAHLIPDSVPSGLPVND